MTFKNYPSGLWRLNLVLYPLHLDPSFPPFILSNFIVPAFIQYFGTSNTSSVFLAISFVFFFAFYQDTSFLSPSPSIHLHLPSFSLCNCTHLLLFIGLGPDSLFIRYYSSLTPGCFLSPFLSPCRRCYL